MYPNVKNSHKNFVRMRLFYANMFNEESVRLLQQRKFDKYNYKRMLQYLQFSK